MPDDGPSYVNKIDSSVVYGNEPQIEVFVKEEGDQLWADISDIDKLFDEALKIADEIGMESKETITKGRKRK